MVTKTRGSLIGIETEAFGADPSKVDSTYLFRYRVVNLDDVISSHTDTLTPNPAYPQELQPRLRDRSASKTQIENIARNLNPRALLQDSGFIDTGPMIVGDDLVVESGNGRILALRKASKEYPEQYERYKRMLETTAERFGIDKQALQGMKAPVLVRERLTKVDRVKFAAEANVGAVMGMSPYEQALQDASRLSANIVSNLQVGDEQTIDQAIRARANDDIVKHFVSNIPATERATIADEKGNVNQQGLERLKLAIFAKTYTGDAGKRLVRIFGESADPQVKTIENSMFASLPDMAKAEGLIDAKARDAELSIAPDMAEVIDTYASLKSSGLTVSDYLAQSAMFEERLNPFQKKLLEHLDDIGRKPKLVREMLRDIAQKITDAPPKGQVGMLGIEPLTKEKIVYGVINKQRDEIGKPAFETSPATAGSKGLEKPDTGGTESAGRLQSTVGSGMGTAPEMATGTSVQTGLAGFGKESAQVSMMAEFGTAPGQGGKKETLIDTEAIKAKEEAKPLPGQIDILTGKTVEGKEVIRKEYKNPVQEILEKEVITAPNVSANDIPYELAERAFHGTSYSPEDRGYRQQIEYIQHMNSVYDKLSAQANTEEKKKILVEEFERYRQGYVERQKDYLNSHSRIVSAFIAGPSKFPARMMNKRSDALDNKVANWIEWDSKAQKAISKKINPTMHAISSDKADAVQLLKQKLESKEKAHQIMVESNKIIRRKTGTKDDKIKEITALGISEEIANKMFTPDFTGDTGFAGWALQNSNADIKRIKERIADIEKKQRQASSSVKFNGGVIEDNVQDNRIQIYFDSKPSSEIISKLKSRGFHWTPSLGAWQRMRSESANYAVKDITGIDFKPQKADAPKIEVETESVVMEKPKIITPSEIIEKQPSPEAPELKTSLPEIITDRSDVQEIKNSIREGELILQSGRKTSGKKMTDAEIGAIQRSVDNAKRKIGITPQPLQSKTTEKAKRKPIVIKPKPEKTASVSLSELQQIHNRRSPQSRTMDEGQQHSIVIDATNPKSIRWIREPGSSDIRGIDTKHGKVRITPPKRKVPSRSSSRPSGIAPDIVISGRGRKRRRHIKL
jgi:hypothetical protein